MTEELDLKYKKQALHLYKIFTTAERKNKKKFKNVNKIDEEDSEDDSCLFCPGTSIEIRVHLAYTDCKWR